MNKRPKIAILVAAPLVTVAGIGVGIGVARLRASSARPGARSFLSEGYEDIQWDPYPDKAFGPGRGPDGDIQWDPYPDRAFSSGRRPGKKA